MANVDQLLEGLAGQLGDKQVFVRSHMPAKKALSAVESYAPNVAQADILVLVDDTVFGGAKEGFLITRDAIHVRNTAENPKRIALTDVRSVVFSGGFTGRTITLNEHFKLSMNMPGNEAAQQLAKFIEKLAQTAPGTSPTSATPPPEPVPQTSAAASAPKSVEQHQRVATSDPAGAAAPLKTISGRIVSATVNMAESDPDSVWLNLTVEIRNDTGEAAARVRFLVTVCSAQGHIIGECGGDDPHVDVLAPGATCELEIPVQLDRFDGALDQQLKDAAIYISVGMDAARRIRFEPTRVSQNPASLAPCNPQDCADKIKVLRATGFFRPDPESPQSANMFVRMIVQNVKNFAWSDAIGIVVRCPEHAGFSTYLRTSSIAPRGVGVFECNFELEPVDIRKTPSIEVATDLVLLEPVGVGWVKHKGIMIEGETRGSADEDLLAISSEEAPYEEDPDPNESSQIDKSDAGDHNGDDGDDGDEDNVAPRLEISEIYFNLDASEEAIRRHRDGLEENQGWLFLGDFQDEVCTRVTVSKLKLGDEILAWQIDFSGDEPSLDSWTWGPAKPGFKLYGGALPDTPDHRSLEEALESIAQKFGVDRQILYWAAIHPEQMTDYGKFLSQCTDDPAVGFHDARGDVDKKKAKAFIDVLGKVWLVYEIHFDQIDFNPLSEEELREGIDALERSDANWRRFSAFLNDGADNP